MKKANSNTIMQDICDCVHEGSINCTELVQIIECAGMFLNIKTIPDYARENKMSYNGAKKFRKVVPIFGVKFIVDNE